MIKFPLEPIELPPPTEFNRYMRTLHGMEEEFFLWGDILFGVQTEKASTDWEFVAELTPELRQKFKSGLNLVDYARFGEGLGIESETYMAIVPPWEAHETVMVTLVENVEKVLLCGKSIIASGAYKSIRAFNLSSSAMRAIENSMLKLAMQAHS